MIPRSTHIALRSLFVLALVHAAPAAAEPSDAAKRIERAEAKERALAGDEKKLALREHSEALIAEWQAAAKIASGSEKVAALEGEARAWARLAHWSGLASDKQRAEEAKQRARAAKNGEKTAEKAGPSAAAPNAAFLAKVDLEVTDRGVEVLLPSNVQLKAKFERIPPRGKRAARVYFDVSPLVASSAALQAIELDHSAIARLRVGQNDADTVRFVFDMPEGRPIPETLEFDGENQRIRVLGAAPKVEPIAAQQEKDDEDPLKVLLELRLAMDKAAPGEAPKEIAPEEKAELEKIVGEIEEETAKEPAPEPVAVEEPAPEIDISVPDVALNKTTKRALEDRKSDLTRIRRVLIDPGHGGRDTGAIGKRGVKEKDVNLAIALALAKTLREKLRLEVVMTRTKDVFLPLEKRVQIANRSGADLFISVHSNAHKNKKLSGIETYYLNTTSNRYANRLAARENADKFDESHLDAPEPEAGMSEDDNAELPANAIGRDLRLLLADLAMRSATEDSRRLAGFVQSTVIAQLRRAHDDVRDLGVKHALFFVLLGSRMPSVLIESGFLSHPEEEKRLSDPRYQQKLAASIAAGIARFIEERRQLASRL